MGDLLFLGEIFAVLVGALFVIGLLLKRWPLLGISVAIAAFILWRML
jgi:hypothetical protein